MCRSVTEAHVTVSRRKQRGNSQLESKSAACDACFVRFGRAVDRHSRILWPAPPHLACQKRFSTQPAAGHLAPTPTTRSAMDSCEAPPADHPALRRGLTLELLDMDQTVSLADTGVLSSSPLSLLSPNAPRPSRSPAPRKPAARPAEQRAARPRSRKPDPRRQSSAIFAGFAAATAGAGLLADDEIAVGDDDILISLPTAAKSQVAGAPGTHLWLEPHTDELLGGDLPEPEFGGGAARGLEPIPESPPRPAALAGGLEPILESPGDGEEPAACSSPVAVLRRASPAKQPPRAGASPLKLPGGECQRGCSGVQSQCLSTAFFFRPAPAASEAN